MQVKSLITIVITCKETSNGVTSNGVAATTTVIASRCQDNRTVSSAVKLQLCLMVGLFEIIIADVSIMKCMGLNSYTVAAS